MNETIEQYKQRIQGYAAGKVPLKVQAKTAEKIEKLIKRIPMAKLRKRPAPDKWSITEIIAHLEDAEIVTSYRIRRILGAPGTQIEAYDQEKWAEAENNAKRDPHAALARVSDPAGSQSRVIEIAEAGAVEAFRDACRARRGKH